MTGVFAWTVMIIHIDFLSIDLLIHWFFRIRACMNTLLLSPAQFRPDCYRISSWIYSQPQHHTRDINSSNNVCTSLLWGFKGHSQSATELVGIWRLARSAAQMLANVWASAWRASLLTSRLKTTSLLPHVNFSICCDSWVYGPGEWWLWYYQQMLKQL